MCSYARRDEIARKCPLTVRMCVLVANRLRPFGTNAVEMLEPNTYECGIASLVFGYGTPADILHTPCLLHSASALKKTIFKSTQH